MKFWPKKGALKKAERNEPRWIWFGAERNGAINQQIKLSQRRPDLLGGDFLYYGANCSLLRPSTLISMEKGEIKQIGGYLTDLEEGLVEADRLYSCAPFFLPAPASLRTGYLYRKDYLDLLRKP